MMEPRCAPGVKHTEGTCYSLEKLVKIAYAYNQKWMHQSAKGENLGFKKINIRHDKPYLLSELEKRLKEVCGRDQTCWIKQDFVKKLNDVDISQMTFRPDGPQGQFEWLSTTHIEDVLSQYEHVNKKFLFLGAVPMDFDNLPVLGIKNLDFRKLHESGNTKIGIVFNTDEHYKPGQHWVAAFANLDKKQVYYFDSTGQKPEKRVIKFLARVAKHLFQKYNSRYMSDLTIKYNPVAHQKGNSECGVYCLNFIIRLLNGESFEEIVNRKLSDAEVNMCRKVYFKNTKFAK